MKGIRQITVNDVQFSWRVGKSNVVIWYKYDKIVIPFNKLFPNEDVDRAIWKRYFHITPEHIADYLHKYYFNDYKVPLSREEKYKKMLEIV